MLSNDQNLFVISASGGSYDDQWTNVVCVCLSAEKAEAEVSRRQSKHDSSIPLNQKLFTEFDNALTAHLNSLEESIPALPPSPKGPANSNKENMQPYKVALAAWRVLRDARTDATNKAYEEAEAVATAVAYALAKEANCSGDELKNMGFTFYEDRPINFSPNCALTEPMSFSFDEVEVVV